MQKSAQKKAQKKSTFRRRCFCAQDETRTHTTFSQLSCDMFKITSLFVPRTGLEPAHLAAYAPETYASTNSATWASSEVARLMTRDDVATWRLALPPLRFRKKTSFSHRGWDLENKCRNKSCNIFTER